MAAMASPGKGIRSEARTKTKRVVVGGDDLGPGGAISPLSKQIMRTSKKSFGSRFWIAISDNIKRLCQLVMVGFLPLKYTVSFSMPL